MTESSTRVAVFDTSALIKHYHDEPGTEVVDRAFDNPDTSRMITDITLIEFHSAFARRVRMGEITPDDYHNAKAELDGDIQEGHLRVEVLSETDKAEAARAIERYGLTRQIRTLDALQLAVMKRLAENQACIVYCADQAFCVILEAEGFTVVNPG